MTSSLSIFVDVSPNRLLDTALVLRKPEGDETILTHSDLLNASNKGRSNLKGTWMTVNPSFRNAAATKSAKKDLSALLSVALPTLTLASAIISYFFADASGWDAIFPSSATTSLVLKLTIWSTLMLLTTYEHAFRSFGSSKSNGSPPDIGLEIIIDTRGHVSKGDDKSEVSRSSTGTADDISYAPTLTPSLSMTSASSIEKMQSASTSTQSISSMKASSASGSSTNASPDPPSSNPGTPKSTSASVSANAGASSIQVPNKPKAAPSSETIPFRFIRATKGDIAGARSRWADTQKWREKLGMDTILNEAHPQLQLIKENYPHYFHLRGKKNECCYYERPPKINLPVLRKGGVEIENLLRHYALCCEYMWTEIESSEDGKSIYVIDLEGIGFRDFAGEVVDFVKRASSFTGDHYPERSGSIFVINVPSWFSVIWNVVKPMVDDVTKKKITILRYGKEAITRALAEKIDIENIPPEYGGKSCPLGQSPEERAFVEHFTKLNDISNS